MPPYAGGVVQVHEVSLFLRLASTVAWSAVGAEALCLGVDAVVGEHTAIGVDGDDG